MTFAVAVGVAAIVAVDADAVLVARVAVRVAIGVTALADGRRPGRPVGTGNNRDTRKPDAAASGLAQSDAVAHAAAAHVIAADSVRRFQPPPAGMLPTDLRSDHAAFR